MSADWRLDVLKFWFGLDFNQWWNGGPELDHRIKQDFLKLWAEKRELPVGSFLTDPLTALAAVVLFDQFPRNMFRADAEQFSTDHLALAIAKAAVDRGFDEQLQGLERNIFYMPFEHSENLDDQNRCVLLQSETGDERFVTAAKRHRAVIERFGRFPHRNAMLGRASRPAEVEAGNAAPF